MIRRPGGRSAAGGLKPATPAAWKPSRADWRSPCHGGTPQSLGPVATISEMLSAGTWPLPSQAANCESLSGGILATHIRIDNMPAEPGEASLVATEVAPHSFVVFSGLDTRKTRDRNTSTPCSAQVIGPCEHDNATRAGTSCRLIEDVTARLPDRCDAGRALCTSQG